MEGDDQQDPIVDTVRSLLDGHIVLDRNLALRNHYPPISVLDSLSRLMPSVTSPEHRRESRCFAHAHRCVPSGGRPDPHRRLPEGHRPDSR